MSALSYFNEPAPLAWDVADAIFGSTGEGGLYDPSALDTIFQDANGTTPAVPGSPVGLVLDARKELGPQLMDPLDFTSGWTTSGATVTSANSIEKTSTTVGGGIYYRFLLSIGKAYQVTISYTATSPIQIVNGVSSSPVILDEANTRTNETFTFVASHEAFYFRFREASTAVLNNVSLSIREVLNPPLSQPTTSARPILARMPKTGRRNLLTWTEDFSQAVWIKDYMSVVETDITAPRGEKMWRLIPSIDAERHFIRQNSVSTANGELHSARLTVKVESAVDKITLYHSGDFALAHFDIGTLSVDTRSNVIDAKIEPLGDGFYEITVRWPGWFAGFWIAASSGSNGRDPVPGDGVSGILISSPQVEVGEPTPYQKVTNAYDVTEEGVPDTYSLVYDLADDNLTTTLPQAVNGDLLIAGTKGSIIEPVSYAAGSTFTLGPDTYTGGTPGIMRAIGDVVGVVLIDRTLTQTERDVLIQHYKGKGAKGLLVPGPELVSNPNDPASYVVTGGGSLEVEDGWLKVTRSNATTGAYLQVPAPGFYQVYFATKPGTADVTVRIGPSYNNPGFYGATFTSESERTIILDTGGGDLLTSFMVAGIIEGSTIFFKDLSIIELRPQEDWT